MELQQPLKNIHQKKHLMQLVNQLMLAQHFDFMNHGIIMTDVTIVNEIKVTSRIVLQAINYFSL